MAGPAPNHRVPSSPSRTSRRHRLGQRSASPPTKATLLIHQRPTSPRMPASGAGSDCALPRMPAGRAIYVGDAGHDVRQAASRWWKRRMTMMLRNFGSAANKLGENRHDQMPMVLH